MDRQTDRQTDRRVDRRIDRETDGWTDREEVFITVGVLAQTYHTTSLQTFTNVQSPDTLRSIHTASSRAARRPIDRWIDRSEHTAGSYVHARRTNSRYLRAPTDRQGILVIEGCLNNLVSALIARHAALHTTQTVRKQIAIGRLYVA